ALREYVTHLQPRLRIVAHRQDTQRRQGKRQRPTQDEIRELLRLLVALYFYADGVALVLRAHRVQKLGVVQHGLAIDLDDLVAGLDSGLGRGRIRGDAVDLRVPAVDVAARRRDAKNPLAEVLALFQPRQDGHDVLERNREANAGVVPLDARGVAVG